MLFAGCTSQYLVCSTSKKNSAVQNSGSAHFAPIANRRSVPMAVISRIVMLRLTLEGILGGSSERLAPCISSGLTVSAHPNVYASVTVTTYPE